MNVHRRTRLALYDLLTGALPEAELREVESHLSACPACARARDHLHEALAASPREHRRPGESLPASYWTAAVNRIENRIRTEEAGGSGSVARVKFLLRTRPGIRRWVYGAAGAVAATAATILFTGAPREDTPAADRNLPVLRHPAGDEAVAEELRAWNAYIRRSRLLLTGIVNEPGRTELDIEQVTSRELIAETRALRVGVSDPEEERLLNAVEPLILKLANSSSASAGRDVDLVRDGVRDQNLLFRLRLAETAYTQPTLLLARGEGRAP